VCQQALAGHGQINRQNIVTLFYPGHRDNLLGVQTLSAFDFQLAGSEIITLGDHIIDEHEHAAGRQQSGNTGDHIKSDGQAAQKCKPAFLFSALTDVFTRFFASSHGSPQLIAMAVLKQHLMTAVCGHMVQGARHKVFDVFVM
jgi:hypothetical protein